jgi:hypothetical protein
MREFLVALCHLLYRAITDATIWRGTTILAVVLGLVEYVCAPTIDRLLGSRSVVVKPETKRRITASAIFAVLSWLFLFCCGVVHTVYVDHRTLAKKNIQLSRTNEDLRSQLKAAQSAPPQKVTKIMAAADRFGPIDRYMDAEQRDHLYQELKQIAGRQTDRNYITVTIIAAYRHDRESSRLMYQLQTVFQDAGWNVVYQKTRDYESPTFAGQLPIGIWVASATKMDVAVESSLINVGLNAETVRAERVVDQPLIGTLILIGYKAAPF